MSLLWWFYKKKNSPRQMSPPPSCWQSLCLLAGLIFSSATGGFSSQLALLRFQTCKHKEPNTWLEPCYLLFRELQQTPSSTQNLSSFWLCLSTTEVCSSLPLSSLNSRMRNWKAMGPRTAGKNASVYRLHIVYITIHSILYIIYDIIYDYNIDNVKKNVADRDNP